MKVDSEESRSAKARLERAARAKDQTRSWRWLMLIGAIGLLALLSFATADYWLLLPLHLRYGTSAVLATVAGLGAWRWRGLLRSPTSLKEAALDAETRRKETDCVVSTAAEYALGQASVANAYEPELSSALQTVAAERLGSVSMAYGRTLNGPMSVLGTALSALVAFVIVVPGGWIALQRVALPWLGAQYTQLEVQPRNIEVRMGHSVEVSGTFFGRPPAAPWFQWQVDSNASWQAASMTPSGNGGYLHLLTNVTVPVKYRVGGGDALSPEFLVTPYFPAAVKQLNIGLSYPDYTKLKPIVQSAPDITILRGSTATVRVSANVSLQRARLCFSDTNLAPVDLQKGEDDLWTGHLNIGRDVDYRIELFDQKGRRGEDDTPHHIVATPDQPPRVEILEPAQDIRADATNRIPVRISVADDYGVAGINLVYHKLNGPEQTVLCQTESAKNGEWIATAEINLATLGLTRYDIVAYHAEARDNNTLDGPGIGRSPLFFIEITDKQSGPTPLPVPMPGEQINLVVVQKQIIADTVALTSQSPATNYFELALRQTNAVELGYLYLKSMGGGASAEAVTEMSAAIASMGEAIAPLSKRDRAAAVPPEEAALAHLYRVLALKPDLKMLALKTNLPPTPIEQKPQRVVALREIKKPAPEMPPADPDIERALEEARELSRSQAELNELGQKLVLAERNSENASVDPEKSPADAPQANADGKGQGQGEGEGQGRGQGEGSGEKPLAKPGEPTQRAGPTNTNRTDIANHPSLTNSTRLSNSASRTNSSSVNQAQSGRNGSTNAAPRKPADLRAQKSRTTAPKPTPPAKRSGQTNGPPSATQLAQAKTGKAGGNKPGKGQGKGAGKAAVPGPKGKGKGQGTKPGDGSGRSSTQQSTEPPEMAAGDPKQMPDTPAELAEKQEELSAEAKALGEMLQRLAGKGTRVGHNLARSANNAAEHMEGAAAALKQGNASGAGMRGTQGSAELDQLVIELERILGKRPSLTDVASEEAPKDYEAFISEYFKRLSYEK